MNTIHKIRMTPLEFTVRRTALGMSKKDIGMLLGVRAPEVSSWEGGISAIPYRVDAELTTFEHVTDALVGELTVWASSGAGYTTEGSFDLWLHLPRGVVEAGRVNGSRGWANMVIGRAFSEMVFGVERVEF